jgi:hypothetical protein
MTKEWIQEKLAKHARQTLARCGSRMRRTLLEGLERTILTTRAEVETHVGAEFSTEYID